MNTEQTELLQQSIQFCPIKGKYCKYYLKLENKEKCVLMVCASNNIGENNDDDGEFKILSIE